MKKMLVLVSLLLFSLLSSGRISAHSDLESAEPAAGDILSQSPANVTLTFSSPPQSNSVIRLLDDSFQMVEGVTTSINGNDLIATLNPLPDGKRYTVEYDFVDGDGHTLKGSYQFSLNPPSATTTPSASPWRGVLFGLAIGLGVILLMNRQKQQ